MLTIMKNGDVMGGLVGSVLRDLASSFSGQTCDASPDNLHHGSNDGTGGTGKDGKPYLNAKCRYCGKTFAAYGSDLSAAYTDYVNTLPSAGFTSSGKWIYWPTGWRQPDSPSFTITRTQAAYLDFSYFYSGGGYSYDSSPDSVSAPLELSTFGTFTLYSQDIKAYTTAGIKTHTGQVYVQKSTDGGATWTWHTSASDSSTASSPLVVTFSGNPAGVKYRLMVTRPIGLSVKDETNRVAGTPYLALDASSLPGTPPPEATTRVGILNGDYIGPDGTKYDNTYIVNETNNTVYNPVTGDTYNISEWNYDYSTRTYNITIDNSQTINVTYGDEYVTIKEGDTITNIYYGGGSGTPTDPEACQHNYTDAVTTAPNCTAPGVKTSTCSKCSKSTTASIPAKGHTWVIERTVNTTYDDAGTLVQKGYTLYKCSICKEQYKDEAGTGPPGGGGSGTEDGKESIWEKIGKLLGGVGDIFITIISATIGKALDGLIALVDMVNQKIESVVNAILGLFDRIPPLFGGFTAFLVAVFPFLPQEVFDIIILAVALVALAAIIRFCLKR